MSEQRRELLTIAGGLVLVVLFVYGVRSGVIPIRQRLDKARTLQTPNEAPFSPDTTRALSPACAKPVAARQLSDAGIAVDSTIVVARVGVFSNVRRTASGKQFGRTLHLWNVAGQLHGYLEQHSGGATPSRGMIESVQYEPGNRRFEMRAFYGDGYFETFRGYLFPGNATGSFVTLLESCADGAVTTDSVTLTADSARTNRMPTNVSLRDLNATLRDVHRRQPGPSYPDPPSIDGPLFVAERFWHAGGTSAAAFTARFKGDAELRRWLDADLEVGSTRPLKLRQILFAQAIDTNGPVASWIAVGPSVGMREYTNTMLRAYTAKDGISHLSYQVLPAELVDD